MKNKITSAEVYDEKVDTSQLPENIYQTCI